MTHGALKPPYLAEKGNFYGAKQSLILTKACLDKATSNTDGINLLAAADDLKANKSHHNRICVGSSEP